MCTRRVSPARSRTRLAGVALWSWRALEYRRWLSHPPMLDAMADPRVPSADEDRATLTASIGARVHFHVGKVSIHPGLSYTRGLDGFALHGPMNITRQTNAVAIAIPVFF